MEDNSNLIDINSAAKMLGVSKLTLRNWDNSGELKAFRIGKRGDRRYRKKDIEIILSKQETQSKEINYNKLLDFVDKNEFWLQEGPMLPINGELGAKGTTGNVLFKPKITFCIYHVENDYVKWLLSIEKSIENCKSQMNVLRKNPQKMEEILNNLRKEFQNLKKESARLNFIDFNKLSVENLLLEFKRFNNSLGKYWKAGMILEHYSPFLDQCYLPEFERIVGDSKKAKESFSILTLPTESSFVAKERKNLLNIILKFFQSTKERNKLLKTSNLDYLTHISLEKSKFFEELLKHQRNFYWVQNNYKQRTILEIQDFLIFIKDILKNNSIQQIKEEFEKLQNQQNLIEKQNNLLKELNLSKTIKRELEHIKKVTWFMDERKEIILRTVHFMFGFLEEFSKRSGVDKDLIGYALIHEIPLILQRNFNLDILERRKEGSLWVAQSEDRIKVFIGNEAFVIKNKLLKEKISKKNEELRGNIANRGEEANVIGKVKIILDAKNQDIKPDEILVTSMTRPEFVPLMRKTKAIITNEGGITCHAAIVSRELNVPCIIGTKYATESLKNGDLIEMKMNHGAIKILEKSK